MVKAYLRYKYEGTCGAVAGNQCPILLYDHHYITASSQYVVIINRKTGESVTHTLLDKNVEITALCLINQGLAVGYQDGDIVIWDIEGGVVKSHLFGHKAAITCLAYNSTQLQLYSGSQDTTIIVWDLIAEELLMRLSGHTNVITALELIELEDSLTTTLKVIIVSAAKDGLIKFWDMQNETSLDTLSSNHSEVLTMLYVREESLLVIGTNSEVVLFKRILSDLTIQDEGEFKRNSFARPKQIVFDVLKGVMFILTADKRIETYKVRETKKVQKKLIKKQKQDPPTQEGTIQFAQLLTNFTTLSLPSKVRSIAIFNPKRDQSMMVLSYSNNFVELRQVQDGLWKEDEDQAYVMRISGNQAPIKKLFLSENDQMLMALSGQECIIYEPDFRRVVKRVESKNVLTACCFLSKNRYFLLGDSEGYLQVIDFHSGEEVQMLQAHQTTISNITYHNQAKPSNSLLILTAGHDRQLKFWEVYFNPQTKRIQLVETKVIYMHDDINHVAFTSSGEYYAVSLLTNTIQIFYCDTHKLYLELYGHALPVLSFSITTDNALLISGGQDKNIKFWGMDFGDCKKSLKAHQDQITTIQIVNETHYFFSGSKDRTLKYWDGDTYELIMQFDQTISEILTIAIGVIGDCVFVGGNDRIIRKYIQTKEQVFIAEEEEKLVEKMLLEDYQKNNKIQEEAQVQGDLVTKGQTIQNKVPQLRSAEDVMNALEEIQKYRAAEDEQEDQDEEVKRGKLMMFNYQQPTNYLFKQLQSIPASSINSVLRFLHIKYLPTLIQELQTDIAVKMYPQITSSILNYVLTHEEGQLLTSQETVKDLLILRDKLQLKLNKERDIVEFNLVAIDNLIRKLADDDDLKDFV